MIKTYTGNESIRDGNGKLLWGLIVRTTFRQQALIIGTSLVALPTTPLDKRIFLEVFNNSTSGQILYIGDNTTNSINGRPIYPRASYMLNIEDDLIVYGISSAPGADIRITEGA